MKNNDFENEILKLINKHIGKSNPIKVEEIMKAIPLSDREIRRIVQYLINEGNNPIGSTRKGPYGFYMIADLLLGIYEQIDYYIYRRIHSALKMSPASFREKLYNELGT